MSNPPQPSATGAGALRDERSPVWKIKALWIVIGGPALVVVASVVTAVIAWRGADEVITAPKPGQAAAGDADVPALQARNHAATAGR